MLSIECPVAQLVLDHSELASIFSRYRIDDCYEGSLPLRVACEERGLDTVRVVEDCELAIRRRDPLEIDPRTLSTKDLITKAIARHHQYLHRSLPFLVGLAQKVARIHGERTPALREVARAVNTLATTLLDHMSIEERELFPALIAGPTPHALARLHAMPDEHAGIGELLATLRSLADDYVVPAWACSSYRALMTELAYLEADTLRHVHLENRVLLPRFVTPA